MSKKISLRLSDEQHEELVAAAQRNERSIQREIVYRLFPPTDTPETVAEKVEMAREIQASAERHFKPDPKSVQK